MRAKLRNALEVAGIALVGLLILGFLIYIPIGAAKEQRHSDDYERQYRSNCVAQGGSYVDPGTGEFGAMLHAECIPGVRP